ncbi:MAG TPA: hypothetical protein VI844_01745, partial [Coxiellaceae bacterium]|nr:hypothetical protein [Coxiellaceae bacterium]
MSRAPGPRRAKYRSRFFIDSQNLTLGNTIVDGTHKIVLGRKTNDPSKHKTLSLKEKKWVLKNADNKLCAQIEAGMTALYAVFKSDGVPQKTRAVYPENDSDTYQVASTYIDHFKSLTAENMNALVDHGLPELLALSYFFEE